MLLSPAVLGLPSGLINQVQVNVPESEERDQDVRVPVLGRHHERGVAEFVGDVDVNVGVVQEPGDQVLPVLSHGEDEPGVPVHLLQRVDVELVADTNLT